MCEESGDENDPYMQVDAESPLYVPAAQGRHVLTLPWTDEDMYVPALQLTIELEATGDTTRATEATARPAEESELARAAAPVLVAVVMELAMAAVADWDGALTWKATVAPLAKRWRPLALSVTFVTVMEETGTLSCWAMPAAKEARAAAPKVAAETPARLTLLETMTTLRNPAGFGRHALAPAGGTGSGR